MLQLLEDDFVFFTDDLLPYKASQHFAGELLIDGGIGCEKVSSVPVSVF